VAEHDWKGTRDSEKPKQSTGWPNHEFLGEAPSHESLKPIRHRLRVVVEKVGNPTLQVFKAETDEYGVPRFKETMITGPNPYKRSLCHVALGPYRSLEIFYYINSRKPRVGIALNQEYGFLDRKRLSSVYNAIREALKWLKTRGETSRKLPKAILYNMDSTGKHALLKTETHGTITQCCLCPNPPTVKTETITKDEKNQPLKIINYFCQNHWNREAPKLLWQKATRINKTDKPYDESRQPNLNRTVQE
jgi:hypothetical protein